MLGSLAHAGALLGMARVAPEFLSIRRSNMSASREPAWESCDDSNQLRERRRERYSLLPC
jgi:hypothetical protein